MNKPSSTDTVTITRGQLETVIIQAMEHGAKYDPIGFSLGDYAIPTMAEQIEIGVFGNISEDKDNDN